MRKLFALAAAAGLVLAAFATPAGASPSTTQTGALFMHPQASEGGVPEVVPEALISTDCTAVNPVVLPNGALSANNATEATTVAFYTTETNCTNDSRLDTFQPGDSRDFTSAIFWYRAV